MSCECIITTLQWQFQVCVSVAVRNADVQVLCLMIKIWAAIKTITFCNQHTVGEAKHKRSVPIIFSQSNTAVKIMSSLLLYFLVHLQRFRPVGYITCNTFAPLPSIHSAEIISAVYKLSAQIIDNLLAHDSSLCSFSRGHIALPHWVNTHQYTTLIFFSSVIMYLLF